MNIALPGFYPSVEPCLESQQGRTALGPVIAQSATGTLATLKRCNRNAPLDNDLSENHAIGRPGVVGRMIGRIASTTHRSDAFAHNKSSLSVRWDARSAAFFEGLDLRCLRRGARFMETTAMNDKMADKLACFSL